MAATADAPLIAMGIVSAPTYLDRRVANRASWMRWPNVGPRRPLLVNFVVRASGAPAWLGKLLALEQSAHGDVWRADVPWNETRLRGPVLSVAAWLTHAPRAFPRSSFVAKLDDDAYFHAPDLEAMLRSALRAAPATGRIYMGAMSWFNWHPRIFERSGYGWGYMGAWILGRPCRNVTVAEERCKHRGCGACVGPFPFASGYLAIFSRGLAAEVASSAAMVDDVARLRAAPAVVSRTGSAQVKVMEDIWLGSLLYRAPPAGPISYVAVTEGNSEALISDKWGLKATRMALIVHIKGKQLVRFLAVDAFMHSAHCTPHVTLRCEGGCRAFLLQRELKLLAHSRAFAEAWEPRIGNASFCGGAQTGAAFCRAAVVPPKGCGRKVTDLMNLADPKKANFSERLPIEQWPRLKGGVDYLAAAEPEAARLLAASAALHREAGSPLGFADEKEPEAGRPKRLSASKPRRRQRWRERLV